MCTNVKVAEPRDQIQPLLSMTVRCRWRPAPAQRTRAQPSYVSASTLHRRHMHPKHLPVNFIQKHRPPFFGVQTPDSMLTSGGPPHRPSPVACSLSFASAQRRGAIAATLSAGGSARARAHSRAARARTHPPACLAWQASQRHAPGDRRRAQELRYGRERLHTPLRVLVRHLRRRATARR